MQIQAQTRGRVGNKDKNAFRERPRAGTEAPGTEVRECQGQKVTESEGAGGRARAREREREREREKERERARERERERERERNERRE